MREGRWPARLGRWLPEAARRDLYQPAVADLEVECTRRLTEAGSRSSRALLAARRGLILAWIFFECVRIVVLQHLVPAAQTARPTRRGRRRDMMDILRHDLRHALRLFGREPAFAAAAVLVLTLGIGATTALFAVVEAALLRPLPYRSADALVRVKHRDVRTGLAKPDIALGDFIDLAARQHAFEVFGGYYGFQSTLLGAGDPVRVQGLTATPELFEVLDLPLSMGRGFGPEDAREGAAPVAIVSHELWRTVLGSDANVLSRSVRLGATRTLIVGVASPGFRFPPDQRTDVIVPIALPVAAPGQRKSGWIYGLGRLREGVALEQAQAELATLSRQFEQAFPQQNQGSLYYVESLRDALVGDSKRPLLFLLAAVGFVLLIACANVGNLLLARSLARQQEFSIRLALGAGRGRVIAQIVTESTVLALAGGLAAVAVAWWVAPMVASLVPQTTAIPGLDRVGINPLVLLFALAVSLVAALVFSGVSCASLTRDGARGSLAASRRTTMTASARRASSGLVEVEIALAVILLIGAVLTLRSFANLLAVDPGFTARGVLLVQLELPAARYADAPARRAFYDRAFAGLEALPAVETVGAGVVTPLAGNNWTVPLRRPEYPVPAGERPPEVGWQAASGGYFRALNIPLRAGRLFDARDTAESAPVVIISESIATQYFAGEDAVGQRVIVGDDVTEIVGVVGDIRRAALTDTPRADMYFPFERQPRNSIGLFIRTAGDPLATLPAIRTTVHQIEPDAVLYDTRTMAEVTAESAAVTELSMRLLGGFAIVALALAAVGVYSVMAYTVGRRSRELATRLALGASRSDIIRLVMRQAVLIAAVGLTIGMVGGLLAARALSTVLYDVPPWDPVALAVAGAALAATTVAASCLPARRASRVDPVRTLAAE